MIRFVHVPKSYGTIAVIVKLLEKLTGGHILSVYEYENQYRVQIEYDRDFSNGYWGQVGKSIGTPVKHIELGDDEYDPDYDDYGSCRECFEEHNLNMSGLCKACAFDAKKRGF